MIVSPGKILADAAVCGVAVLFSLALAGCGGGFGGAEGSPILDSGPPPEKIAVAAGDDISAEEGRKVAETVSRLNLGLGGGSVSPEDVRVSHDRAVLDRDPFSASSGVPAARKLGVATTRALRGRGYKAFEFPVPAESPIMTVAVWISETPPPDQKAPEGKTPGGKPGDAPAKTIYVRLQVFVSPAKLGLAGSDAMVRELETEEVAVQVKTPKPKPQPETPPLVAVHFWALGSGALSAHNGEDSLSSGDEVSQGATVIFTAAPAAGHYVSGWGGACAGSDLADRLDGSAECWLAADADLAVEAEFSAVPSLAGPLCPAGTLPANGLTQVELTWELHLAAKNQKTGVDKICEWLRRGGRARGESGRSPGFFITPLNEAVKNGNLPAAKLLLAHGAGANVFSRRDFGLTPLRIAAAGNNIEMAALMLANGADVNKMGACCTNKGRSPLYEAAIRRHMEMVEFLLANGADIELGNGHGSTPLMVVVSREPLVIAEFLLANGADVNAADEDGRTALWQASYYCNNLPAMMLLVAAGADVNNKAGSFGHTPLHEAVRCGSVEMVRWLLANGADVNVANNRGHTPLERARDPSPRIRNDAAIIALLEAALAVNVAVNFSASGSGALSAHNGEDSLSSGEEVRQGATVVFTAAPAAGHYVSGWGGECAGGAGAVVLLHASLGGAADAAAKDCALVAAESLNVTAVFAAVPAAVTAETVCAAGTLPANGMTQAELDAGLLSVAQRGNYLASACEYLRRGANVETGGHDNTPLAVASSYGRAGLARLFLNNGADPNRDNALPLRRAAVLGHTEVVRALLDGGARIDAGNSDGFNALLEASHWGNWEVVELLLSRGADADARNSWGGTALYVAVTGRDVIGGGVSRIWRMAYNPSSDQSWVKAAEALVSAGATVNARVNTGIEHGQAEGFSALDYAAWKNYADLASILRNAGGVCYVQTGPLCAPLAGLATVTVIVTAMDESSPLVLAGDAAGEATTTVRVGEATEIGRAGGVATLQATAYLLRRVTVIPATTVVTVLVEAATGENPGGPVSELIGLATLTNQAPPEVVVQAARLWKVSPTTVTVEVRTLVVKAENPGEPASELIALATVTNQAPPGIVVQVRELRTVYEFSALAGSECPSASLPANGRGVSKLTRDLWKAIGEKNKEKACEALRRGAKTEGNEFSLRGNRDGSALEEIAFHFWGHRHEDKQALADITEMVLARGANVNYKEEPLQWTPLHHAARYVRYSPDMVSRLLRHGAEVNARGKRDRSPLDLLADRAAGRSSSSRYWSARSSAAAILREAGGVCFAERKALCWDAAAVLDFSTLGPGALSAQSEKHALSSGDAVPQGATVVFTAAPNAEHYVSGWTGGCAAVGGTSDGLDGTAKECALTADSSELRVRARFSPIPSLATADCPAGSLPANGLTQAELNLALRAAARGGNPARVCEALRRGAEVNDDQGGTEFTPLQEAVHGGHLAAAEILLANGAEVNARKEGLGPSPLDLAAKGEKEKIARALRDAGGRCFLETGPLCDLMVAGVVFSASGPGVVSARNGEGPLVSGDRVRLGMTVVFTANPESGHYVSGWAGDCAGVGAVSGGVVDGRGPDSGGYGGGRRFCWLAADSDLNVRAEFKAFPSLAGPDCPAGTLPTNGLTQAKMNERLMEAVGRSPARVCEWLRRGADVNSANDSSIADWFYGEHLIYLSPDAEIPLDESGHFAVPLWTPLHLAAYYNREGYSDFPRYAKIAEMLIANGADVNARDSLGVVPLHAAADADGKGVAELLIRHGADVNARDAYGWPPLYDAALHSSSEVAKLLIENGADVNNLLMGDIAWTFLHEAVNNGATDIVKALVDHGADVDARDPLGDTPLHFGAEDGKAAVVGILIAAGADVAAENNKGETPLDLARRGAHSEIVAMLEAAGAPAVASRSVPVSEDRLALELRGRFGDAFNAGPAFGDSFGAVSDSSGGLLSRLDGVMRGGVSAKEDWASFSGWQQENGLGRLWFSTRHRGDFGFGAGGGGLGGAVDGSPFAALSGNGLLAGGEMALGSGGSERLRFAAFGDLQSRSLLSGEERRWTDWAASGTAIETAMAEAERLSGVSDNRTRGALTEIHLGDSGGGSGLAFQAGALSESESLLAGTSRGEDLRGLRSRTAFAGVSGSADLFGGGWRVRGAAHVGRSWAESSGVLRSGDLWASSFSAGLERGGWLYSGDGVMFRISQPLRVESWEMDLMEGGEVRRLLVSPSGRQLDLDAAYRLPLSGGGWLLLSAGVRRGSGHVGSSGLEGGALFSLERDF